MVALGGVLGLTAGSMGSAGATIVISFLISGVVLLIGYVSVARTRLSAAELLVPISIAMIVVVPFWTFRYVLPLAPFLFFYFLEGLRVLAIWIARRAPAVTLDPWSLARVAILCIIGLDASDHARYILDARNTDGAPRIDWVADAHEFDTVLDWMKQNLTEDGAVATTNPALVFLETGRKGLAIDDCGQPGEVEGARGTVCRLSPPGDAARGAGGLVQAAVSNPEAEAVGD